MPKKITMIPGQRFGRLTVLREHGQSTENGAIQWLCICDCGEQTITTGQRLRSGKTRSCGCLRREAGNRRTHGRSRSVEHTAWLGIRGRCLTPTNRAYARYGGRGITICERWHDFAAFYADIGARPSPKHSIDRIDNNGPYSPENCRWATPAEQSRNRRNVPLYEHDGLVMALGDWADKHGMSVRTLKSRVERWGWEDGHAVTRPLRKR